VVNEAISKLQTEMEQAQNNSYVQVVGGFLLKHLDSNPVVAEKILDPDKTIIKSLDAMREEARKNQVGGVGVLTDAEGFAVVLKYFGIEEAATPAPGAGFIVKLDDLL